MSRACLPTALTLGSCIVFGSFALASTPTLTVTSPQSGATLESPVHFVASATSPACPNGVSAVGVYTSPGVLAYSETGSHLNTYIPLASGTYSPVVQVWDNCGGVAKVPVSISVHGQIQPMGHLYTVSSNYFFGNTINQVNGFQLLPNGALAPTGQPPVKANVFPMAVAGDQGGYRLYVGDYISGDVSAYYIYRNNGYIYPVPGSPFPVNHSVTAVAVHPSGAFVYATRDENAAGDGVAVFRVQSNGSLASVPGSPYSTENGPQAVVVDPSGKYLYVADATGFIDAFNIDQTSGALTPLPSSPFRLTTTKPACGPFPDDIIDPTGKRLYTSNAFDDSISGYSIAPTVGTITQIAGSPWPDNGGCNILNQSSAFNPESITIDGTGKFLYGINGDVEDIAIYSIQSNGSLKFLKYTPNTSACGGPIRTDPKGNYLYTVGCANTGSPGIVEYAINHTNGNLTPLPSSPMIVNAPIMSFAVTP